MTPASGDPIAELSHDHGHLSTLVLAVRAALVRMQRAELSFEDGVDALGDAVEALRDALLSHFAREEEGFFPFVEDHVPALRPRLETLRAEHDSVCQRADELSRAVHQEIRGGVGTAAYVLSYERFEELYATHAQSELAFLKDVDASLDEDARERLRTILAEI